MIERIEYRDGPRYAEIAKLDECMWRVFVYDRDASSTTVFRKSLTSAQSTARVFIQSGRMPR